MKTKYSIENKLKVEGLSKINKLSATLTHCITDTAN
jgi:hypothetical protein